MYRSEKPDNLPQMAGFDIFADARQPDEVSVWPENELSVHTFVMLQTQWRVGMSGLTGLDYTAALAVIDRMGADDPDELFADIRVMEQAALEQIHADRKKERASGGNR